MKITLCGSIAFYDEMVVAKQWLEEQGHEVRMPPSERANEHGEILPIKEYYTLKKQAPDAPWVVDSTAKAIMAHYKKIEWSDAVLVVNEEKNKIPGYVGGNTLMEMGLAFFLGKKIFLMNQIPELSYKEEILGMKPVILGKDLTRI